MSGSDSNLLPVPMEELFADVEERPTCFQQPDIGELFDTVRQIGKAVHVPPSLDGTARKQTLEATAEQIVGWTILLPYAAGAQSCLMITNNTKMLKYTLASRTASETFMCAVLGVPERAYRRFNPSTLEIRKTTEVSRLDNSVLWIARPRSLMGNSRRAKIVASADFVVLASESSACAELVNKHASRFVQLKVVSS